MKSYKDLNLKAIRESCDLDFAHYTYGKGQCSCCYGPLDMPGRYWRGRKRPVEVVVDGHRLYEFNGSRMQEKDITWILFKNAGNGSGRIKNPEQTIKNYTCIEYHFRDDEQKCRVCQTLLDQLDEDYFLGVPKNNKHTIIIFVVGADIHDSLENFDFVKFGDKVPYPMLSSGIDDE